MAAEMDYEFWIYKANRMQVKMALKCNKHS